MYSYSYDATTGGIVLNSSPTVFSKEPRPVWAAEMNLLGFHQYWNYDEQNDIPYMWAESNAYWYRGTQLAKIKGGDLYTAPELMPTRTEDNRIPFSKEDGFVLQPIDISAMSHQNEELMTIVENTTVKKIVKEYEKFKNRLDIFHVAFSGGKDSAVLLDLIKKALPIKGLIEPNDKHQTITSQIEHHAVLNACSALERLGYPVVYLPVDSQGVVLSDSLSKAITEKTKLVSVMMVNNEIGTIEPIKELATIAHTHNVLFHTDAVQAVGHIPIDVNELGIDMLSSSAHKFNGPKGIGFLYIRKGTQIRPLADGGAQEFHMRAGTENIASIVGMAVALKKNCRTMQETSTKLQAMDHAFIDVLHEANVDFIRNGSVSKSPGIISVSIRNISGEMLLHRLDLKGISISTGSACDSVNTQVSHVIKAIGVPSAYAQGTIRISFGHDNQIEDAVEIAHAIAKILQT